jgi:hypothetical protein
VAQQILHILSQVLSVELGSKLENIGKFWLSNKKHGVLSMVTSAALWCIWKRADPVPEAPTRVGSGEGNNRSKVFPPQKFCRETASNPGPGVYLET